MKELIGPGLLKRVELHFLNQLKAGKLENTVRSILKVPQNMIKSLDEPIISVFSVKDSSLKEPPRFTNLKRRL